MNSRHLKAAFINSDAMLGGLRKGELWQRHEEERNEPPRFRDELGKQVGMGALYGLFGSAGNLVSRAGLFPTLKALKWTTLPAAGLAGWQTHKALENPDYTRGASETWGYNTLRNILTLPQNLYQRWPQEIGQRLGML